MLRAAGECPKDASALQAALGSARLAAPLGAPPLYLEAPMALEAFMGSMLVANLTIVGLQARRACCHWCKAMCAMQQR